MLDIVAQRLLVPVISTVILILAVSVPPVQLALCIQVEIVKRSAEAVYTIPKPLTQIARLDRRSRCRRGGRGGPYRLHIVSIESVLDLAGGKLMKHQ